MKNLFKPNSLLNNCFSAFAENILANRLVFDAEGGPKGPKPLPGGAGRRGVDELPSTELGLDPKRDFSKSELAKLRAIVLAKYPDLVEARAAMNARTVDKGSPDRTRAYEEMEDFYMSKELAAGRIKQEQYDKAKAELTKEREGLKKDVEINLRKDPPSYKSIAQFPPLRETLGKGYNPTFIPFNSSEKVREAFDKSEDPKTREGRARMIAAGQNFLQMYQYTPDMMDAKQDLDDAIQEMIAVEQDKDATNSVKAGVGDSLKTALNVVRTAYIDMQTDRLMLPVLQIPASYETAPMRNQLRQKAAEYLAATPQTTENKDNLVALKDTLKACTAVETGQIYKLPGAGDKTPINQETEFKLSKIKTDDFKIFDKVEENQDNTKLTPAIREKNNRVAGEQLLKALTAAGWKESRDLARPLDLRDNEAEAAARKETAKIIDPETKRPIEFKNRRQALFDKDIDANDQPKADFEWVQKDQNINWAVKKIKKAQ